MEPFIESLRARFDALEPLKETINKFIYHVNKYFYKKYISYHLDYGFTICYNNGEEINELNMLSSGERQLLLLFANTITASGDATFFIIDEPEISLNIKWQRMFISSILDFNADSNVQFILATHSFELLTAQPKSLLKLQDLADNE